MMTENNQISEKRDSTREKAITWVNTQLEEDKRYNFSHKEEREKALETCQSLLASNPSIDGLIDATYALVLASREKNPSMEGESFLAEELVYINVWKILQGRA